MTQVDLTDPAVQIQIQNFLRSVTPIETLVRQDYPQMAWVLNNPELGPIMRTAVAERWDPARLMGRIQTTNWWQTTGAAQREYERLRAEDPRTAFIKFIEAATQVRDAAARLGVTLTPDQLKAIGTQSATEGWDPNRMQQEVIRNASGYDPNAPGDMKAMVDSVKARSNEFFMPMTDATAFNWTKNMLTGAASKEGLDSYLRQQAVNRFSGDKSIVDALANGATVKDIFDPYAQQTAQLLEVAPEQVNLMDQQWGTMIDGMRTDGTRRPMTLSESAAYVRGTDAWKTTKQAGEAAAGLAETINKTFGEVA